MQYAENCFPPVSILSLRIKQREYFLYIKPSITRPAYQLWIVNFEMFYHSIALNTMPSSGGLKATSLYGVQYAEYMRKRALV